MECSEEIERCLRLYESGAKGDEYERHFERACDSCFLYVVSLVQIVIGCGRTEIKVVQIDGFPLCLPLKT